MPNRTRSLLIFKLNSSIPPQTHQSLARFERSGYKTLRGQPMGPAKILPAFRVLTCMFACMFAQAYLCTSSSLAKQDERVIKLVQVHGNGDQYEVLCTEQKLRVHSLRNGWTLMTFAPMKELILFKDYSRTFARVDSASLPSVLGVHAFMLRELPPLAHSSRSLIQGLPMTQSDFSGKNESDVTLHRSTIDRKNDTIGEIMYTIYDLPHSPGQHNLGLPLLATSVGKLSLSEYTDLTKMLMFEHKQEPSHVENHWTLRTFSLKRIPDNDALWKLPRNYQKVDVRDVVLGEGWRDAADEFSKGIFTKSEQTGEKMTK
jgi:hypothetical protein